MELRKKPTLDLSSYQDIGLNADWNCSCYNLTGDYYLFDDENDTFSLLHYDDSSDHNDEKVINVLKDNLQLTDVLVMEDLIRKHKLLK
jgi:hypothetical protein